MTLVGDSALCERCRHALVLAGLKAAGAPAGAAARGLSRTARQAGMLAA